MIDLTQSTCNDELSLSELTVTLVRDVIPEGFFEAVEAEGGKVTRNG